jgi:dipeptidase E
VVLKLLLISNSTAHGEGYLDHCIAELAAVLGERRSLVFVPFAIADREAYGRQAAARLSAAGIEVEVLRTGRGSLRTLEAAEAVFVGGGNTFRLLDTIQSCGLLEPLRERVCAGMPYLGASAGSNLACPTIRTTNDMPIVQPASFAALGLVPFQINPHYLDAPDGATHMGETREQRLVEYLEANERPVVGLREDSWIRVEGDRAALGGRRGVRIFRRGREPEERPAGADLTDLLSV